MDDVKDRDSGTICVADITIAQLSQGLYRSTATAFKELVSNAHDADATEIRIDTNFPEFDFVSCLDDGTGMPVERFLIHFRDAGIGSCSKRQGGRTLTEKYKRPVIGKLGVGMLAVGQICHSFEVESHYLTPNGVGEAYHGRITLRDLDIPTVAESEAAQETTSDVQAGTWQYELIDFDEKKTGFRIYSDDLRQTFMREMRLSLKHEDVARMSFMLEELQREFYAKSKQSIRECLPYLETIWELGILCPLPYYGSPKQHPIAVDTLDKRSDKDGEAARALRLISTQQRELSDGHFRVVFDGIDLRRFIQLPTTTEVVPQLYYLECDEDVFGSRLAFAGYLFVQVASAIKPRELNGVQIRLKRVGIGGYDSTFLRYAKEVETIRSRWVSGEIFVTQGLESALNIDRDSFNEHDEHYKKLQTLLHNKLDEVFDRANRSARLRSEGRRVETAKHLTSQLSDIVFSQSKGKLKLAIRGGDPSEPVVEFDRKTRTITLNSNARIVSRKSANRLVHAIEIAYFAARELAHDEGERHTIFLELLKKIITEI